VLSHASVMIGKRPVVVAEPLFVLVEAFLGSHVRYSTTNAEAS
jgi:hypothetical protein